MNDQTQLATDRSFQPVWQADARILILGSLPGKRSIAEQGYYAHPRNQFWPIMARYTQLEFNATYERRIAAIRAAGVALWDVVGEAHRPGSLDSAIDKLSIRSNPIPELIADLPELEALFFNGTTAWNLFHKAARNWPALPAQLALIKLPSTSPAHAAMNFTQKSHCWHQALDPYLRR